MDGSTGQEVSLPYPLLPFFPFHEIFTTKFISFPVSFPTTTTVTARKKKGEVGG